MRRKLAELRDTLTRFVEQRDHLLLVVSCADPDVVYPWKMLEGIGQAEPSDVVLLFREPFASLPSYTSAILASLRAQREAAAAAHAARGEGEETCPPFPDLCGDEAAAPIARLRAAIDHVSSFWPVSDGHRVIWAFLPLRISDQGGYARLAGEFVPWRGPELWMRGLRVIARDDRLHPFLCPALRGKGAPGVLLHEIDMSQAALEGALAEDAADGSLPVAERMQALMQLAALDHAHRRYPEAIEKYKRLHDFHAQQREPAMQAMALQGVGDALRRSGERAEARLRYQQGITLALRARALPVLFNLTFASGEVSLELGDAREAEGFFALAARIAGALLNPSARAAALEKQGVAGARAGREQPSKEALT